MEAVFEYKGKESEGKELRGEEERGGKVLRLTRFSSLSISYCLAQVESLICMAILSQQFLLVSLNYRFIWPVR